MRPCDYCGGTGLVEDESGDIDETCPDCLGSGEEDEWWDEDGADD